ncbi:hypothetical protein JGF37_00075 [Salmonella enterica subsp. enterica serovar Goldcoast]|nr:hypothetical protein [Salmonella enterica subsp. enterica serovar Goldcoast]
MTSREKFEAWMTSEQWFHGSDFEWDERRNCYAQFGIHLAYKAFMAAEGAAEQKLTDMAVQLANSESKCRELAAENVYLLPKAASELSNAWVLHKYLIGIQAAIMYLDGGSKKAAQEWLYGTIAGPGFEFPDEVEVGDDIDAWATHQMRDSISHPRALEIIKAETPATDTFLAEVRAHGVEMFAEMYACEAIKDGDVEGWKSKVSNAASEYAAQLRKGAAL